MMVWCKPDSAKTWGQSTEHAANSASPLGKNRNGMKIIAVGGEIENYAEIMREISEENEKLCGNCAVIFSKTRKRNA